MSIPFGLKILYLGNSPEVINQRGRKRSKIMFITQLFTAAKKKDLLAQTAL